MSCEKHLNGAGFLNLLIKREIDERYARRVQSRLNVTERSIERLGLEKELLGHSGCVNCLEWNEAGSVLASASDDVRFILWDPFRYRRLHTFETGHRGNIFSVKFLPKSKDNTIVTGAGDCKVRVHDVILAETTLVCSCHNGRVKRLATAPDLPFMFWSAGEDGVIMEFDLREPHCCNKRTNNILVSLRPYMGKAAEAKCLAINPCKPELLAVGANDPFIRLYDRRMIRPVSVEYPNEGRQRSSFERQNYVSSRVDNLTEGCVQYYAAGHLTTKSVPPKKKMKNLSSTYLTFSSTGVDLLVNLGGEQIYLFDINNKREITTYDVSKSGIASDKCCDEGKDAADGLSHKYVNGKRHRGSGGASPDKGKSQPKKKRSERVHSLKVMANSMFDEKDYTRAINEYNKALCLCSDWSVLYGNRAAAFMKRAWDGDIYAALRDCIVTLKLEPDHVKAHFRLAKCLYELNLMDEAHSCLNDFREKHPSQAEGNACKALAKEIKNIIDNRNLAEEMKRASERAANSDGEEEEEAVSGGSSSASSGEIRWNHSTPNDHMVSEQEQTWRGKAFDYESRYCGHCNTTTDIKEANFFGSDGQFIVAGSDDGSFFIWDRYTTNIVQVLKGDDSIVNCLQPHPTACLLATSGIDPVVRLWSPLPDDGRKNERAVLNIGDSASANQRRMNSDPLEVMLINMGYRLPLQVGAGGAAGGDDEMNVDEAPHHFIPANMNCRPS